MFRAHIAPLTILSLVLCLFMAPRATRADNAANDFVPNVNPNGNWSYGWSPTLGGTFVLDIIASVSTEGLDMWNGDGGTLVFHNGTGVTQHIAGTTTENPGDLDLHPGFAGQKSVVRWTAPGTGTYDIVGTFVGASGYGGAPPTTTDVTVLQGPNPIFSSSLNLLGGGDSAPFSLTRSVLMGESIEFAVGYGNNDYLFDSTELTAEISPSTASVGPTPGAPVLTLGVLRNPARGEARFAIGLPAAGEALVRIFDLSGRMVREVTRATLPVGVTDVVWDGLDASGRRAPAGLYLVRLDAAGNFRTAKLVVER